MVCFYYESSALSLLRGAVPEAWELQAFNPEEKEQKYFTEYAVRNDASFLNYALHHGQLGVVYIVLFNKLDPSLRVLFFAR